MVRVSVMEETSPQAGGWNANAKTLRVLEAALLSERFTDIVDETGLAKSTVHRILASLIDEGFVAGDADQGYRAGRRFMALAGQVMAQVDISRLAAPVVDRLVAEVDCTVHVGALSGDEMVYLIRTDSSKPYRMRSRVGLAIPLHPTGMGKAVMASWDDDRIRDYAERTGLPPRTPATITDLSRLREVLAEVRQRGYALDLGENELGTVCVSAPIYDHTGKAMHGLSISSIALEHPDRTIEQFAPHAVAAADEISRLMGSKR